MKNFAEVRLSKTAEWIEKPTVLARCETFYSTAFLCDAALRDGYRVQFRVYTADRRWTAWEDYTKTSEALEGRIPDLHLGTAPRFGQSAG